METETAMSFPVARDPPPRPAPQTAQLGQAPEQHGWGRWAFLVVVSLVLTGKFAWDVYQVRHSPRSLAFVIVTYDLVAVLCCCLVKQSLLRRDDRAVAPERRRVGIVVWVVSVALAIIIAARVALVMPYLALKIAVLVITGVGIGLAFCFSFTRADAGRQTDEQVPHQMSPEQRV
ncbi:hypothetical protein ACQ4PT_050898 [Festuca glaucescens]